MTKKKRNAFQNDVHVNACKKEKRRIKNKECRDYKKYEKKRKDEYERKRLRIKRLKDEILATWPEMPESEIARFLCIIDMVFRDHSLRGHVTYMREHPGSVNTYGINKVPSKSGLYTWVKHFSDMNSGIQKILCRMASKDAYGSLAGDASGFSVLKREDWEDAKKGLISRREFDKLHLLMAPHGMIVACKVTRGRALDSPIFYEMYTRCIPDGHGHVMLDAAYPSQRNCEAIASSGRTPVICPKSNMKPKGFSALAKMLRWNRDSPKEFKKIYHQRSLVETVFSVIKKRFGENVRARLESVRSLLLTLKCICYNLVC